MDADRLAEFRTALTAMRSTLDDDEELGSDGRKTVMLDQQSVGRLSRMDALQHQAMAKAGQARRGQQRQSIAAALSRIDDGEYGYCTECGEEIVLKRLELDPTLPTCVSCASG